jgi:hypothetical protein
MASLTAWMTDMPKAAELILGGWQLGGILSLQTGLPFTVNSGGGITNAGGADRPNRIGNGALPDGQRSIDRWFDLAAFVTQPQFTYGNSGRNILGGPGSKNLDLSLAKSFAITERYRMLSFGDAMLLDRHLD